MALNDELRIAFRCGDAAAGREAWIIRNYRVTATDGSDSPTGLGTAFFADVAGRINDCLPQDVNIERWEVASSFAPTVVLASNNFSISGGLGWRPALPDQVCALIRLMHEGGGTWHPGKVFVPYVPVFRGLGNIEDYKLDLEDLAEGLISPLPIAGGPVVYTPVIWKRRTLTSSVVLDYDISYEFWTQRRRIPRGADKREFYPMCFDL